MKKQIAYLFCSLLLLGIYLMPTIYAGDICDMTGSWMDGFNFRWTLEQDEDASITGQVVGVVSECPPQPWDTAGSIDGDRNFVLNATCPCDPMCASAMQCQNFTFRGALAADCNSGSGTWMNCQVGAGQFTIRRTEAGVVIDLELDNGIGPGSPVSAWRRN